MEKKKSLSTPRRPSRFVAFCKGNWDDYRRKRWLLFYTFRDSGSSNWQVAWSSSFLRTKTCRNHRWFRVWCQSKVRNKNHSCIQLITNSRPLMSLVWNITDTSDIIDPYRASSTDEQQTTKNFQYFKVFSCQAIFSFVTNVLSALPGPIHHSLSGKKALSCNVCLIPAALRRPGWWTLRTKQCYSRAVNPCAPKIHFYTHTPG